MSTDWENQLILTRFRVDMRLPGDEEAYRAWDNQTNQAVSLHILPETDDESRRLLAKSTEGETRIRDLERVAHPGVLPYLGLFELSGQSFWVEGYVDGPTLRFVLNAAAGHSLPLEETLIYIKSLSSGLAALHELGWVHGNLRPESVRLGRDGTIYLAGLFAARRLGDGLSTATDVSALALILYEMLAGSLPDKIPLPDLRELNPHAPEFLARTLPRALDENADNRISSATEFFLTACLASRVEADKIPERVPYGRDIVPVGYASGGAESPSAALIETWNYLPPITPPPAATKALDHDRRRRPSAWVWLIGAGAVLGVGLMLWYFSAGQSQVPAQVLPTDAAIDTVPTLEPLPTLESIGLATDTAAPTINAPDGLGGRIVFTCTRSDLMQLCMVKPTGDGGVARLTGETAHDFYPSFSPNGKAIVFASNRGGNYDLYLKVFDGDILIQLTTHIGDVSSASFSPDGKTIVFSNNVAGKPSLWTVDADGKHLLMLYEGVGNIASPVWSPNGKSIAFVMSSAETPEAYEAFIYDTETKNIAPVTQGHLSNTGGSVDWSPDGHFLLLFAGLSGAHEVYRLELVSGEIIKLTDGGNNFAPSYSPDGQWIVFNSMRASKDNANIFIMRPDGSDVRQLTTDTEPDWQPRWGR